MNWYKFLTETNKIHNDERPPDRLPMFQLVLREQGPLFKTVDKVIRWINHLSSGQLLLLKSCPLDKCALSWTTFVKFNWVRIKFYPVDKINTFFVCSPIEITFDFIFLFNFKNSISLFFGNRLHYT